MQAAAPAHAAARALRLLATAAECGAEVLAEELRCAAQGGASPEGSRAREGLIFGSAMRFSRWLCEAEESDAGSELLSAAVRLWWVAGQGSEGLLLLEQSGVLRYVRSSHPLCTSKAAQSPLAGR